MGAAPRETATLLPKETKDKCFIFDLWRYDVGSRDDVLDAAIQGKGEESVRCFTEGASERAVLPICNFSRFEISEPSGAFACP